MTNQEKLHIRELATQFINQNWERLDFVTERKITPNREIKFAVASKVDTPLKDAILMEVNYTPTGGSFKYNLYVLFNRRGENGELLKTCTVENSGLTKKMSKMLIESILSDLKAFSIEAIFSDYM